MPNQPVADLIAHLRDALSALEAAGAVVTPQPDRIVIEPPHGGAAYLWRMDRRDACALWWIAERPNDA